MTKKSIPTTLLTGFFGVGKTTTIRSLLSRKPENESWAILINEFGEVAVDQTALEINNETNVTIREIPGGCICCVMNVPMREAVAEIFQRSRPDRLLIEPTGLGHPAGILDQLRSADLKDTVDVGAVVCLVDPRFIDDSRIAEVAIFRDQVYLSDILIASKIDLASAEDLKTYYKWAKSLFPPKLIIGETTMGDIDLELLDLRANEKRLPLFQDLHSSNIVISTNVTRPSPRKPVRAENKGSGYQACGWIFSHDEIFDQDALIDYLGPPGPQGLEKVERIKGAFRIGEDWLLIDRVKGEMTFMPIAYRRDSRLEAILPDEEAVDWDQIETELMRLLK